MLIVKNYILVLIVSITSLPASSKICDSFDNFQVLRKVSKVSNKMEDQLKLILPKSLQRKMNISKSNLSKRTPNHRASWCKGSIKNRKPSNFSLSDSASSLATKVRGIISKCTGEIVDITTSSAKSNYRKMILLSATHSIQYDIDFGYYTVTKRDSSDAFDFKHNKNRQIVGNDGSCTDLESEFTKAERSVASNPSIPDRDKKLVTQNKRSKLMGKYHNFAGDRDDFKNLKNFKCP